MTAVNQLFEMLSWNSPEELQKKGVFEAKKVKYLSIFFQPLEDKSVWGNCAEIISSKSDGELFPYILNMLEWLQDCNWPGYDTIFTRLSRMSSDVLMPLLRYCIDMAQNMQDDGWLSSLLLLHENILS